MEEHFLIALCLVPGIGSIGAKRLLSYTGSAEAVFRLDRKSLLGIPGVGPFLANRILDKSVIDKAGRELEYIRKNNITCLFPGKPGYPQRLEYCEDAPLVLYLKGKLNTKGRKLLSVVGTRRPTRNGVELCRKLIRNLAERHPGLVIISGLAYGIDQCAHRAALESGLETVAVLGHGFKYLYPDVHRSLAGKIVENGSLLTDFPASEKPERANFIKRNRIIAGISEATVVVESGLRGGALITADLANSYHRDVFAFPGRATDPDSAGCNELIKSNRAALIEHHRDLEYLLGWDPETGNNKPVQKTLFAELNPEEISVMTTLEAETEASMDLISFRAGLPVSRVSSILLKLELSGLVNALPGNAYRIGKPD